MLLRIGAPLALACLFAAEAAAGGLEAPYQVDAVTTELSQPGTQRGPDMPRFAVVDLDPMQAPTQGDMERWSTATVLTPYGTTRAHLVEFRRSCGLLCGVGQQETCHWQAVLQMEFPYEAADVVAVLPGEPALSDPETPNLRPVNSVPAWSKEFHTVAWPTDDTGGIRIDGWNASTKRLQISAQVMGEEQSIDQPACRAREGAGLTQIQCQSIALIAADGVPLLVSSPDYTDATAEPVAAFHHQTELYVLVRLGLQAQTVYGFLVKRAEKWVPLFRKAERAFVC
jgi:hypothetical protein